MPGAGKTTVGKRVAQLLARKFFDSDAEIERLEGRTCAEIIESDGEPRFREIERGVVAELAAQSGIVLAVGGGAPVYNADLLKTGIVAWLVRPLADLAEETGNDATRPLSKSPGDLERLYAERREKYAALADFSVSGDGAESTAQGVLLRLPPFLTAKLLVINGPNLNMLGVREPGVYGSESYADLIRYVEICARERGVSVSAYQSNGEGELVTKIQDALGRYDGVVINPGAYTHYSYAVYDALRAVKAVPAVEVHISDIHSREEFRKISVTAPACIAQISGRGFRGYAEAMDILLKRIAAQ
jgi:3-dehydroquinate dehydratase type II